MTPDVLEENYYSEDKGEVVIPYKKILGEIICVNATKVSAPNLITLERGINCPFATEVEFPNLTHINTKVWDPMDSDTDSTKIDLPSVKILNFPNLTETITGINPPEKSNYGEIYAGVATKVLLPKLKRAGAITVNNAEELDLPELETAYDIFSEKAEKVHLPKLIECKKSQSRIGSIYCNKATELEVFLHDIMGVFGSIYCNKATELCIPLLEAIGTIRAKSIIHFSAPKLQIVKHGIKLESAETVLLPNLDNIGAGLSFATSTIINTPKANPYAPKLKETEWKILTKIGNFASAKEWVEEKQKRKRAAEKNLKAEEITL